MIGLIKGLPRKVNMAGSPQPIVTFTSNVSGLYLPEILAYIQASQSGTGDPSPSNPRAISGVSEVTTACNAINQWDEQWELGSINNSDGTNVTSSVRIRSKNYIEVKPNTSICVVNTNAVKIFIYKYGKDKSFLGMVDTVGISSGSQVVNIPSDCYYLRFRSNDNYTYSNNISFNYPATATSYHTYTGQTATTALGMTCYGGYLNVTTGLLTVTDAIVDLGSLTWTYRSGNKLFTAYKSGIKLASDAKGTHCLCDIYKETYGGSWSGWANFPNEHISSGNNYSSGDANIAVKDLSYTDKDTFKTAMNGVKLVYELATPQTIQLTPAQIEQLLGENNVFCSSGDVAVTQIWARRDRSIISRG